MDCMIKALADCPKSVVAQVEAQFEAALNMSTAGQTGAVVSYQDTKSFMQSQCSKLPSGRLYLIYKYCKSLYICLIFFFLKTLPMIIFHSFMNL